MKWRFVLYTILFVLLTQVSCKKDNNTVHSDDVSFLMSATLFNKAEIITGGMASSNGMRDSIRIFGSLMVTSHTAQQKTIDSLATLFNIILPAAPDSAHQAFSQQLSTLSGYTFDTAYIRAQVIDHKAAISFISDEISNGHNVQIKNYAGNLLPVIQRNYNMASSIFYSE